ncbi:MAG TPA: SidA/IucD/PvdA family monooxygenase [Candidatus Dormibacteraeota bacterium]|nr:SidA/IucD/PvdA family monooxygenase [Candidatus Dormibacteraeota bacterium]
MSAPVRVHDLLGVGIGPFNLGLAALLDGVAGVDALFVDEHERFSWHPGLMLEGTTTQVPFLADLVSLVDPTSPHSFLNYLRVHDRLLRFYLRERFHLPRREYDHYCGWVAERLPTCRFGTRVEALRWLPGEALFEADLHDVASGRPRRLRSSHVVLGVGTVPYVPEALAAAPGPDLVHAADYLPNRERIRRAGSVVVVGSGQSGAEVFLDLLREQPAHGYRLTWITRSAGFLPMEYTRLALEHFSPEYTRYFHGLAPEVRDRLLPTQDLLSKGIDAETIEEIYGLLYERSAAGVEPAVELRPHLAVEGVEREGGSLRLRCRQWEQGRELRVTAGCAVLATGFATRPPACIEELRGLIDWDGAGRYRVGLDYRVAMDPSVTGSLFVQNAELHTHGVGAPDLGLGAHRGARIVNEICGREVHRLPRRTVVTEFGVA